MTFPTDNHQQHYDWLYAIIASCEDQFHFDCANNLIELFGKKFPDAAQMKILLVDLFHDLYQEKLPIKEPQRKTA